MLQNNKYYSLFTNFLTKEIDKRKGIENTAKKNRYY